VTTGVRADRLAFLIDAADYFRVLVDVLLAARRSILVVAWDVDSRLELIRDGRRRDHPVVLVDLLEHLLDRRPQLEVRVLCWDYSVIYALEREAFQRVRLGWSAHERLHFAFDDRHPPGASHHQKIVVVDDRVAFVGGIDLGRRRWDTSAHRAAEPRRTTPAGSRYPPFHDVQAMVSGPAARALGEVARERWRTATGDAVEPPPECADRWPDGLEPAVEGLDLRVVRTVPAHDGQGEVRETESWLLEAIGRAEEHIWIESQYLTSEVVADALADRLRTRPGLTVAAVTARENPGWLEKAAMGALRARFLARLSGARAEGRFGVYWPRVGDGPPPNVHSKLLVADDTFAYVGSANLSNRSMGLDTECGLAIDASRREDARAALRTLRLRLLSEHLGLPRERLEREIGKAGHPVAAIEALRGGTRALVAVEAERPGLGDLLEPLAEIADPVRPPSFEELVRGLVP